MGFRRTSLVLYILFIFHLHHNFPSVSSRPSSVDTKHETLPFSASKPDVVGFEGKARELVVVMKRGGGGGRGGGSRGGRSGDGAVRIPTRTGVVGTYNSSGSSASRGAMSAIGWLGLAIIAGLFLVQ